jgi:hypothetical protein
MSTSLVHVNPLSEKSSFAITQAQAILRKMVLDSVQSIHSKRNYAKALDDLFTLCGSRPLSRALLMEYRTTMNHLSPSTINVRLSAIRKLVSEARRNGMIGLEEAADLNDVPNVRQKGTRLGNWLTREQAKELLAVPDRSTLKGKRDYVIIALLVGCALRRRELATLNIEDIQLREGRWVPMIARAGSRTMPPRTTAPAAIPPPPAAKASPPSQARVTFPLFYVPLTVEMEEATTKFRITLKPQVLVYKRAVDYILQETSIKAESASPISERILYATGDDTVLRFRAQSAASTPRKQHSIPIHPPR